MEGRRVVGIVALCAAAAVAAILGGTVLQSRNERTSLPGAITTPLPGKPALQLELGLRVNHDPEAKALWRAQVLLDRDRKAAAALAIFQRYDSVEARLGAAFAGWTGPESLASVQEIAASAPTSAAAQLNLGWASYQAGHIADAVTAWQSTATTFPDSPYAIDALDALNRGVAPNLPPIVVDPGALSGKAKAVLLAGVRQWDLKHVVSARRDLDLAAQLAPHSPEALVAAAVARFSPDQPKASFPVLGPLTATFPQDSIVRLHLGVLLLWSREISLGKEQLRLATTEQPRSVYANQARLLLAALAHS
jgi:hypothetical protein